MIEADESDGSFLRLDGTIAVVTNIDPEHLEHYGSFERSRTRSSSSSRTCPSTASRSCASTIPTCRTSSAASATGAIVTFGFSALADVRADNVAPVPGGTRFDALILDRDGERRTIDDVYVPIPGRHNVQNALAAIAVALELGISDDGNRCWIRTI